MDKGAFARDAMTDMLCASRAITSREVEAAMRAVPRHRFLTEVPTERAYADRAVTIKYDRNGVPISSASQPAMVAQMLEQLEVGAGDRVLEIGTATGYNAALLAELAGPSGRVVTVELEEDLAERAGRSLSQTGYARVRVVRGDGRVGFREGSPYDRIVVTAGVREVPPAWIEQLAEGGRMVVPVVNSYGEGISVMFELVDGELEARSGRPCGFVPLRSLPV
ncbi:MAG: protein-L-isoaspartate O-methyltransferase [Acidimicrobiales bacterium]